MRVTQSAHTLSLIARSRMQDSFSLLQRGDQVNENKCIDVANSTRLGWCSWARCLHYFFLLSLINHLHTCRLGCRPRPVPASILVRNVGDFEHTFWSLCALAAAEWQWESSSGLRDLLIRWSHRPHRGTSLNAFPFKEKRWLHFARLSVKRDLRCSLLRRQQHS